MRIYFHISVPEHPELHHIVKFNLATVNYEAFVRIQRNRDEVKKILNEFLFSTHDAHSSSLNIEKANEIYI